MIAELRFRWGVFVHHVVRRRRWPTTAEIMRMPEDEFLAWLEKIGLAQQVREALKER